MENIIQEPAVAYKRNYTEMEFLNMEWEDCIRYEYWDGQLVAMDGATLRHNEIVFNLTAILKSISRDKKCKTFFSDVFLKIKNDTTYFLPDILFTCHPDDIEAEKFIQHPSIIVEVLSDSTELYDRKQKWDQYRKIKSLRHYLLVNKHTYKVEMFSRTHEIGLFYYQVFEGVESSIAFSDLGFALALKDIYEGIEMKVEKDIENDKGHAT